MTLGKSRVGFNVTLISYWVGERSNNDRNFSGFGIKVLGMRRANFIRNLGCCQEAFGLPFLDDCWAATMAVRLPRQEGDWRKTVRWLVAEWGTVGASFQGYRGLNDGYEVDGDEIIPS